MSACCPDFSCAECRSPEAIAARAEVDRRIAEMKRAMRLPKPETDREFVDRVMKLGRAGALPGGPNETVVRGGAR